MTPPKISATKRLSWETSLSSNTTILYCFILAFLPDVLHAGGQILLCSTFWGHVVASPGISGGPCEIQLSPNSYCGFYGNNNNSEISLIFEDGVYFVQTCQVGHMQFSDVQFWLIYSYFLSLQALEDCMRRFQYTTATKNLTFLMWFTFSSQLGSIPLIWLPWECLLH